ncbi:MAG: TRAP transporter small permease [Rhodobacteraceae bacterium]|nr:TRAP transporter small permease [Paracoccaceae bacterium]
MTIEPARSDMTSGHPKRPIDPVGRMLERVAVVLAGLGGIVLLVIVSISFVSIIGRFLFSSPLLGDFELVEMGCAVAIASFLPLCQLRRGNVIVDFATAGLPPRVNALLDGLSAFLYALVASFFTWRMYYGAQDMFRYSEETMLLRTPVWIPFLPVAFSFFILSICCFYTAYNSFQRTMRRI